MATSVSRAYTANRKVTSLSPNVKYQLRKYLTKRCSLKEHSFSVCQVDFIGAFKQKEACPLHFHYHLPLSHPFFWSLLLLTPWASQVALAVKNPPASAGETWEVQVRSLGQEDPLEEDTANHSSILAWKTPRTEEPGGLWSMGSQRVNRDWSNWVQTVLQIAPINLAPVISTNVVYHQEMFWPEELYLKVLYCALCSCPLCLGWVTELLQIQGLLQNPCEAILAISLLSCIWKCFPFFDSAY